jgi:hypothetical protein
MAIYSTNVTYWGKRYSNKCDKTVAFTLGTVQITSFGSTPLQTSYIGATQRKEEQEKGKGGGNYRRVS